MSPLLANIYLDKLDQFVEKTLIPPYHRGTKRKDNPAYSRIRSRLQRARKRDDHVAIEQLTHELHHVPQRDTTDPDYRRLRYCRYADDFLLGFTGPRDEAEEIKRHLQTFLLDTLKLEMSEEKTLITHARTERARFLGYEIHVLHNDTYRSGARRSLNGATGLRVPENVIRDTCAAYMHNNKPIHLAEKLHDSVFGIMNQYQAKYRGLVEYYKLAYNCAALNKLYWVVRGSLLKTLACKLHISCNQAFRKYRTTVTTEQGTHIVLQVKVEREGREPLVATFGGISLARKSSGTIRDTIYLIGFHRTELVQRLLADRCELCGSHDHVEVHHIRALKDLNKPGRREKPEWARTMAARKRKTLICCHTCHLAIHQGKHDDRKL